MRYVTEFPRPVREIMTQWIPMRDGTRLAARIWLPEDADREPVPALLEYLPYRRRDGTAYRDSITQPYLAGHGYAAVRVDIRGTGDSGGLIVDEYDLPEQLDGVEVIEWLARQPWCSGDVGMWGISWGGFNALQVAALAPPALKAVITLGFTDDRYNGDCHYMGGCLLEGNISWGTTFFSGSARPPDPDVVGPGWREQWLARLEAMKLPIETWLRHQRRDDYWKPGSVCEDYARIKAAVYAISGWQDSYSRCVFPLLAHLSAPKKALVGPWAHGLPHMARPGPTIGFMQESLRWWDHWLKGKDTGIMDEPMFRAWMGEWTKPSKLVPIWPGRWVAEAQWPIPGATARRLALSSAGIEENRSAPPRDLLIRSPQTVGFRAGYQNSYGLTPDLAGDQRTDDGQSVCFDSLPLASRLEIFGEPELELEITSDREQALLSARLCDVAPDGASLRVSYGLLNLSHRDSDEHPEPLEPGKRYKVRLKMCGIAYAFPPGHRMRIALSTSYWPIAWPSPQSASVTLHSGASVLVLPVREPNTAVDASLRPFEEPEGAEPKSLVELRPLATDRSTDRLEEELGDGRVTLIRTRDRGAWRTVDTDVEYDTKGEMRCSIREDDPLSAVQELALTTEMGRPGWRVRTEVEACLTSTADAFVLTGRVEAFESDRQVFTRSWNVNIKRDLV